MISGICEENKTHSCLGNGVWVQKAAAAVTWLMRLSSEAEPPSTVPKLPCSRGWCSLYPQHQRQLGLTAGLGFKSSLISDLWNGLKLRLSFLIYKTKIEWRGITVNYIMHSNSLAQSEPLICDSCLSDQRRSWKLHNGYHASCPWFGMHLRPPT